MKLLPILLHAQMDILGVPRAEDLFNDSYINTFTNERMIQNFYLCKNNCLNSDGIPKDMFIDDGDPKRDYAAQPYGDMDEDFYVDRDKFLEYVDYDFYNSYLSNNGEGNLLKNIHGYYGLKSIASTLDKTSPTSSSYLCNLGIQRRRTTAIRIKSQGCMIQIASTEGDGYHLYVKQLHRHGLRSSVRESIKKEFESGCRTQEVLIEVINPSCKRVQVPGTEEECARECSVILFKGYSSRRLPIIVESLSNATSPLPTLRIDDQYLVLESQQTYHLHDLAVTGGSMNVELSYARVRSLECNLRYGTIHLNHLRHDYALIAIEADDIALEDNRNYELQYRSAGNLVCEAAPLIEEIPEDFLMCVMEPEGDPDHHAHTYYDDKLDGYIDMSEFLAGMQFLGLSNGSDSLDLDEFDYQALINHVFSVSQPEAALQELTYELFEQQLNTIMPPLTTLYDSNSKDECLEACPGGLSSAACSEKCLWYCREDEIHITEPIFGECDVNRGCTPSCGNPDTSISGNRVRPLGGINYHNYDMDPPDGVITIEEMRQALLKIYSNCTYYIEPHEKDYTTCEYLGRGQYDLSSTQNRRQCKRYAIDDRLSAGQVPYDYNKDNWRINNPGLPEGSTGTYTKYKTQPRECRPFPDYDPKLNGKQFDASATRNKCPECFLPDGSLVPPHYFNRSTWSNQNYDVVMNHLRRIFTPDLFGYHFAYFNISDDDQFRHFTSKLFTGIHVEHRVTYTTFNANLQTLSVVNGIGKNFYLFNPWCYRGSFLKTAPGDYSDQNIGAILEDSRVSYNLATGQVQESNMPGYPIEPHSNSLNPCPNDWGSGMQGSTEFSYFPWADGTSGRKWGKALPVWCLDEISHTGGIHGMYPNDVLKYGSMAGKKIPPGCEPIACTPRMQADVNQGSIHAQVLPFKFDAHNTSGRYHQMIDECVSPDGSSRCFVKGYSNNMEDRFRESDEHKLEHIKHSWVGREAVDESVIFMDVKGFGIPNFKKWFWTSRRIYMQLEPAWLSVFSLGVLDPIMVVTDLHMTPGFCNQEFGAVPDVDWKDNATYGGLSGIRGQIEKNLERILKQKLQPEEQDIFHGSFYLKQVWRKPYPHEDLMFNAITYNPLADTEPGFLSDGKSLIGRGPSFRHHRACTIEEPCDQVFAVYRDNCLYERAMDFNETLGDYVLGPCQKEDGSNGYLDPVAQEAGLTFNESEYYKLFPRAIEEYSWDEVKQMSGEKLLQRNHHLYLNHHSYTNLTTYFFDKIFMELTDSGEVNSVQISNEIVQNPALLLSLVLSVVIAGITGMGFMTALLLLALKALGKYRTQQKTHQKIDAAKRQERIKAVVDLVAADHRQRLRKAAQEEGADETSITDADLDLPEAMKNYVVGFVCQKWNSDSDVSTWKVEEMKAYWDR